MKMHPATGVAAFVVGIAILFAGAAGIGRAVGPTSTSSNTRDPGHPTRTATVRDPVTQAPGGVQVSDRGYSVQMPELTLPEGPWSLAATVVNRDGQPVSTFRAMEGEQLHFVVVRTDLDGYQHLHPRRNAAGAWTAPVNLAPGTYRLQAQFQPVRDEDAVTLGTNFIVSGSVHPGLLPSPSMTDYPDGGYEADLQGSLRAGTVSRLTVNARRAGTVAGDPEPYLVESGNLVVLRVGDLASLRIHPGGNGRQFDVEVPSAGTYRIFFDFVDRSRTVTAAFTAVADRP